MPLGPIHNATLASRLGLAAVCLAALSIAALVITVYGMSHPKNLGVVPMASLVDVGSAAACTALVGAPISLVLSILAMKARSRCLNPRPKLPLVALSMSTPLVASAMYLAYVLLVIEALKHHGS